MVERYLKKSVQLKAIFLLLDIRHAPSENDQMMYDWICANGYRPILIATKLVVFFPRPCGSPPDHSRFPPQAW